MSSNTVTKNKTPKISQSLRTPKARRTLIVSPSKPSIASNQSTVTPKNVPKQRGLPWRTAERAAIHKYLEPADILPDSLHKLEVGKNTSLTSSNSSSISQLSNSMPGEGRIDYGIDSSLSAKQLQAENVSLKRRLAEESAARAAAEDRALELARENRRLQSELRRSSLAGIAGENVDEELLTQVEQAFSKFNKFLDVIKEFGLGDLINEAGLQNMTSSPVQIYHQDGSFVGTSTDFENFMRQRNLHNNDIITHADSADPPKTYSEQLAGSPMRQHQSPKLERHKREQKRKEKEVAEVGLPDTGTFKLGAFELQDASQLETPDDSPRKVEAISTKLDIEKPVEGKPPLLKLDTASNSQPSTISSQQQQSNNTPKSEGSQLTTPSVSYSSNNFSDEDVQSKDNSNIKPPSSADVNKQDAFSQHSSVSEHNNARSISDHESAKGSKKETTSEEDGDEYAQDFSDESV